MAKWIVRCKPKRKRVPYYVTLMKQKDGSLCLGIDDDDFNTVEFATKRQANGVADVFSKLGGFVERR